MEGKLYGYVRVSTKEQNLDRQLVAMRDFGVPESQIYDVTHGGAIHRGKWVGYKVKELIDKYNYDLEFGISRLMN